MKKTPMPILLISGGMPAYAAMLVVDTIFGVSHGRPYRIQFLALMAPFLARFAVQLYRGVPSARREVLAFGWFFVVVAGFGLVVLLFRRGFSLVSVLSVVSYGLFGGYTVVMLRSKDIRELYAAPAGPTMRSSDPPPASAVGGRSL